MVSMVMNVLSGDKTDCSGNEEVMLAGFAIGKDERAGWSQGSKVI